MFLKKLRRLKKKKLRELWEKCILANNTYYTKKYRHQLTTKFAQLTSSFGMTFSQTPN